ncbi:DeoR family transcriptional regulator [Paenibacillus cellulosilyticus]|uniref:DeoR family transcriptional regulator n=1 Tax=Paenibacillus cellulosilyticus TaxID=375489 RepID=A0A2V2YBE7_9BACL|nr:DeoR/GlpR family DNA-binding transcription regulator [Paenibacillus cellulosilyticus]PWV88191.1 DeoR family transcriptional regulator [Paenibacillus cellulosilyticus]QKS44681.1 DeoR/GlpR transcriptional regulator [Paenibacillus cellulosilyticus]
MLAEERRQLILDQLHKDQRIVVKELAQQFQLSVDSIRRDLSIMEEQGLLKKSYGGAVPINQVRVFPKSDERRYGPPNESQDAISKLAASYIQPGDAVFIGGAGIHFGMLQHLPRHYPITIVTNAMKVADTIKGWDNVDAYLIGGKLRTTSGNFIDPLAIEQVRKFSFDICFVTGGGFTGKGISMATPDGGSFMRAVIENARTRIGLAPNEKLGRDLFASSIPLAELDILITDKRASRAFIQQAEKAGVQVVMAQNDSELSGGNFYL